MAGDSTLNVQGNVYADVYVECFVRDKWMHMCMCKRLSESNALMHPFHVQNSLHTLVAGQS